MILFQVNILTTCGYTHITGFTREQVIIFSSSNINFQVISLYYKPQSVTLIPDHIYKPQSFMFEDFRSNQVYIYFGRKINRHTCLHAYTQSYIL